MGPADKGEYATAGERLNSAFWWLWTSTGLSNLADGAVKLTLPLVAIQYTRSPALIGGLGLALTIPWLLFALPAGALADRLDRRRTMIGSNAIRILLLAVLLLALMLDAGSIWLVYLVALGLGTTETLYDTSAQSIVPQIVGRDLLSRANSRLSAAEFAGQQFIGPPLGGLLIAVGAVAAVSAPLALWALALVAMLMLRGRYRVPRTAATSIMTEIREGLRFLTRHTLLRTLAGMIGLYNFAITGTMTVLVLYGVGPDSAMMLSEFGYGVLLTTYAVGIIGGSLIAEQLEKQFGRATCLAVSMLLAAASMAGPAVTANPYVVGAGFVIGGIGVVVFNVISLSLRQKITPDRLLGRVNSAFRLVAWGTLPLGAMTAGLLAEGFGLRWTFAIMSLVALLAMGGMATVTDERMAAEERAAEAAAAEGDPPDGEAAQGGPPDGSGAAVDDRNVGQ